MAKKAKGAKPLSESEFIDEVVNRLGGAMPKTQVRAVVKAMKEEIADCLANGYKVTLTGLVRFEPKFVPEKKKGEPVRNPSTGETAPRAKTVPASFKAKAFASSSLKKVFPTIKSSAGTELAKQLKK